MDHGHGNDFYWQGGGRHAHDGWWGGPLHPVVFLLLVALLVVGVVWLVRRLSPGVATQVAALAATPPAVVAADPAVAALRMRYARGDVSREDFQHALEDLTGAASALSPNAPAGTTDSEPG